MVKSPIKIEKIEKDLKVLLDEQNPWEDPWRSMINYILPAKGNFISDGALKRINLVPKQIVNNAGKEAAVMLASALEQGITPRTSEWLELAWMDDRITQLEPLQLWLYEVKKVTLDELLASNFYDAMYTYYLELPVFCNTAIHSGRGKDTALEFNNYAIGEYVFRMDSSGKPDPFIQVVWLSAKTISEEYGMEALAPLELNTEDKDDMERKYPVVKAVYKYEHRGKPYTSVHFIRTHDNPVLRVRTYDSCPNHIGRWDLLSNHNLAIGPGFDAITHIRKLQQSEKALSLLLMKIGDPPMNIPAELKNKANTLPGGENYLRGDKKISPVYDRMGDPQAFQVDIERLEEKIKAIFHNDVFLTTSRDPNASPLRTGQVNKIADEALVKLGPVVGRTFTQTLKPMIERCINVLYQSGKLPPIPEGMEEYVGEFKIELVSPLAKAMKMLEHKAMTSFLGSVSAIAQFNPEVLDNVEFDETTRKFAEIDGIPREILRTKEQRDQLREERKQAALEAAQKEEAMIQQQVQRENTESTARVAKDMSTVAKEGLHDAS